MSKLEKGAEAAPKTYYYKICEHCGAAMHIDNEYCVKCKGRMRGYGKGLYKTEREPEAGRSNLDHPNGCPSCGLGCRYCFSFGAKEPHPKAYCEHCGKTGKARVACCINARKLPTLMDAIPDLSLSEILAGKAGDYKEIREKFAELYAEEVAKCWAHIKAGAEVDKSLAWLKRGA